MWITCNTPPLSLLPPSPSLPPTSFPHHPLPLPHLSHLKLPLRIRPLRLQRHIVQFRLRRHDHLPLPHKPKVRTRRAQKDLAYQNARRIPDRDAVADPAVDVAPGVAVNAVGEAGGGVGECGTRGEGAVEGDVVAVAVGRGRGLVCGVRERGMCRGVREKTHIVAGAEKL